MALIGRLEDTTSGRCIEFPAPWIGWIEEYATNGRIILFAVVFGIAGIGTLIAQFIDMTPIINIINKLDNYLLIAIPIIYIILLGISYLISSKIYQNKEF